MSDDSDDKTVIRPGGGRRSKKPQPEQSFNSSQQQQGFNQNQQQDFNQNQQQGFNQNQQQDFNQNQQQGFNQNQQQGFNQNQQQNFNQNQQQGFNQNQQQGFNPNQQQGFNPNQQQGFNPNQQQGFNNYQQQPFTPQPGIYGSATRVIDTVVPLLSMTNALKNVGEHPNIEEFKFYAEDQIRQYQANNFGLLGQGINVDRELVHFASYGLCVLIDELVLNTPWGIKSSWSQRSLGVNFHQDATGGKEFFTYLDEMLKRPSENLAVLSLYYVCLELGFKGQYRNIEGGSNELNRKKSELYSVIVRHQPHNDTQLSLAWQGVDTKGGGIIQHTPLWVIALVTLGLGVVAFTGFYWSISDKASWVNKEVAKYHQIEPINVVPSDNRQINYDDTGYDEIEAVQEPDLIEEVIDYQSLLTQLLAQEIEQNKVEIADSADEVFIKLVGSNMFGSGSKNLSSEFVLIVNKIAEFLAEYDIAVEVKGHTDSDPIRTVRFADNHELSQARAESVMALLKNRALEPNRISAVGLADSQPIDTGGTAAAKAKNRRVEIVLIK